MKLLLLNTSQGLKPMYDSDYDEKKKLKIGEIYLADVKVPRNVLFHRKYFALINCAWEYQNENTVAHFNNNVEGFRKTVEIAAGWYEPIYSIERKEWTQAPKSISFGKMKQEEFDELYERVKDVLFNVFLKNISIDDFMSNLSSF